jgi:hypothetical protein
MQMVRHGWETAWSMLLLAGVGWIIIATIAYFRSQQPPYL